MEKIKELYLKYKSYINYVIFGVGTTIVSLVTFFIFNKLLNFNELIANVFSWIFAVLFAYITNKKYVFESSATTKEEIIKEAVAFYGARLITLGIEELVLLIGSTILNFDPMIVKLAAQVIVVIANYVFSKLFVFKK